MSPETSESLPKKPTGKKAVGRPRTKPLPLLNLPYEWEPRGYQLGLWHYLSRGGKRAVLRWHRRSGKDEVCLHFIACAAHMKVATYWYMLPEYSQARKSMWDAVNPASGKRRIDEAFPEALRKATREQEMMIVFKNGSTFQLVGADNFNSLVGSPPYGLVFSEYALTNPSAWGYLSPILLENNGFAVFNSTPRGANHFKKLCEFAAGEPGWFYQILTVEDTRIIEPRKLQADLREKQENMGDDHGMAFWRQEWYVSFDAAIPGSIWGDCVIKADAEGRIYPADNKLLDRTIKVNTAWDLGFTDDTAIWWFQMVGSEVRVLDYFEASGKDVKHYAEICRAKAKERSFEYGTHWLPHDARPRTMAAGGKSIMHQLKDEAIGKVAIVPRLDREEGIQAGRATFRVAHFDGARCEDGIEALREYHREWDAELKVYSLNPKHDWSSHAADAWRYLSLVWRAAKAPTVERPLLDRLMDDNVAGLTFGALKKKFFDRKRAEREMRMG